MAEDPKERLIRYLNDAHAAEDGGVSSLKAIAAEMEHPEVKAAVEEHLTVTQSQADRLEARIKALGGTVNGGKSLINNIISAGSHLTNIFHDKDDKQTQDIIKAYALENFEIGMYTSLKAYADAVGDHETAQLANTIMSEEQLAAERMLRFIPQLAVTPVGTASGTTTTA